MYEALYSQDIGLCGFRCRVFECTKVVRTQRGILMHCRRVHGLVAQMNLPGMENSNGKEKREAGEKSVAVRIKRADRVAKQRIFEADCERELFDAGIEK